MINRTDADKALTYITYIGATVSTICLLVTIVAYLSIKYDGCLC